MKKIIMLLVVMLMAIGVASAATVVSDFDNNGWGFLEETATGLGSFETGPETPPLGGGSVNLVVDSTGGIIFGTSAYAEQLFSEITALEYSTYRASGAEALAPALQFNFDSNVTDNDTSWQGRIVYEPYHTETVLNNTWQTWNPLDGLWWGTGAPLSNECPQSSPCTWDEVLTAFPDSGVNVNGGVLFKAGSGWSSGFDGNVDAFTIGILGANETYDFESSKYGTCKVYENTTSQTVYLLENCTTEETILVADGWTLDGNGYTITAVETTPGAWTGAVVQNEGATANVINLGVTADNLAVSSKSGADRLRGIMFDGASGTIQGNTVTNIYKGPSGLQEGNAIEVRNAPFDGNNSNTLSVLVKDNEVVAWQKTGILANGDLDVTIENNKVGESASNKELLAPNSIQVGYGALATVRHNIIEGSSWCGTSNYAAAAILLYDHEDGTIVSQNNIRGDSDIGIYLYGGETIVDNNKVFEDKKAEDCNDNYDIGIGNWGAESEITNNKVKGFDVPYSRVDDGKNKVIPGPNGPNADNDFW